MRNYQLNRFASLFSEGIESETPVSFDQQMAQRRKELEEDFLMTVLRWSLDSIALLHPSHIRTLPAILRARLKINQGQFPGTSEARYLQPAKDGFVSPASEVSPAAMLDAYGRGLILRWVNGQPTWWSPPVRFAGAPAVAKEPESALDSLAAPGIRITLDRAYDQVIKNCARKAVASSVPFQPGQTGLASLAALHDAGYAHSVEIWNAQGVMIAGCHGIASGRAFVLQSRFGISDDAADLALVMLNRHLAHWDFVHHDLGVVADAARFGFRELAREEAQTRLTGSLAGDRRGRWLAVPHLSK